MIGIMAHGARDRESLPADASACCYWGVSTEPKEEWPRSNLGEVSHLRTREASITGHRTRSVFDRYHIVTAADLQETARKLAARS